MRAVVLKEFGGVENLADMEWPDPSPGEGEVRIRVKAASVNPTDFKARRGGNEGKTPLILGRDVAGVVDGAGKGAGAFKAGDEVMAYLPRFGDDGGNGYAELACVPQEFVAPKPRRLSFAEAAAVPLTALTAYEAVVMKARFERGESAFVAGASGGVGTMAVQMLRILGAAPVLATAGGEKSAAYLREKLGLEDRHIVRYSGLSVEEAAAKVQAANGGRRVKVAVDLVGRDMKRVCMRVVDYWGHVCSIASDPDNPIPQFFTTQPEGIFWKSCSFHAVFLRTPVRGGGRAYFGQYQKSLAHIREWLETGALKPPMVTEVGPLNARNIGRAHLMLEEGHVQGKLVLPVG
ncbi:MAG: NADP-dependent oxidoreductase [Candidatus Tectomicrobia bacterium]|uniref:NADP-dependent oxidoreductase n=1 Tax=Tectimicrobiota bacterium TaxID=2528274 RepID=A0A932I0Y6_UNCTE|nr:NADP-dependent oxidoreductase [Candidatus Tectomicrobia bacterium]